jgi:hypothetical protein
MPCEQARRMNASRPNDIIANPDREVEINLRSTDADTLKLD